jgi:ABC-2 type transport system ATP-binding protein
VPAVEAVGIRKQYGSLVALEDFHLAVEPGEVLGVLGPNGAGKTTAIRILTTILRSDRGDFTVAGIDQSRPGEIRRRIGVLPESAGYPERLRGEEYLRYHSRLFGQSRASAAATSRRLLEEVGLAERGHSLIGTYSRGMRQRLGLARTLVNDPTVVFLDEPTLGLDPAGQIKVLQHVRAIASERGAAVLLCSHLLAEVEDNCSRVLILNRGRLVVEGTVAEVVRRAAAPRSLRLQVAPEEDERAARLLAASPAVDQVERVDGRPGQLALVLAPPAAEVDGGRPEDVVRALLDAGLELRSFELEGARLSDAFLAMTEAV